MKKTYYSDAKTDALVHRIIQKLFVDDFKPDYIVGLTRGGLVPAIKLSHYLNVPLETLKVSLRDGGECESNCWMAEDAYDGKKILIVDDINDSGATLQWIKDDWSLSAYRDDPKWQDIWHQNVKFAVLVDNEASSFGNVDYVGHSINKVENPEWIVFPWEKWWVKA